MNSSMTKEVLKVILLALILIILLPVFAYASGAGLPWESPLEKILDSVSGPVAKVVGIIVIVLTGLGIAFGEGGGLMRKVLNIVFGLSVAFSATSFGLSFFGFSGGCAF